MEEDAPKSKAKRAAKGERRQTLTAPKSDGTFTLRRKCAAF